MSNPAPGPERDLQDAGRKIFIGGVPFGVDQHMVKEDFMQYGDIEDVYLPTDRETGKLRGFAFVTFRDSRDAHDACGAMHGRDYHGRQITVNIAKPRDGGGGGSSGGKGGGKGGGGGGYGSAGLSYTKPRDYDRGFEDRRRYDDDRREVGVSARERDEDDRFAPRYSHGNSYDGTGRYGDRDPRPTKQYYD